ncbi:hypothetical protein N9084_01895 [Flavobacteriales bacterium]|nr:hypothetical protein [Flavobacteriales bacterium]
MIQARTHGPSSIEVWFDSGPEAVAIVNRQLDVHGKRILRILTLEDPIYGAADAVATGWLDALVARIRAQRSILEIISWDRSGAPVPHT